MENIDKKTNILQSYKNAVISSYIVFKSVDGEWQQESIVLTDIEKARTCLNDIKKRKLNGMLCMVVE